MWLSATRPQSSTRVHDRLLAIHADVRLHPEVPLVALARLVHLRVPLAGRVLGRRRRMDDGRVHDGARADARMPLRFQVMVNRIQQAPHRSCPSSRWRKFKMVVSSGAAARPRSTPANRRSAGESYSASSAPGSDRLNQCWRKQMRNIMLNPTGGRPLPSRG